MRPAKENYMPYKEVPKRPTYCQDCKIVEHIFAKETYLLQHTFAKETYLLSRLRDRGGCGTSSMLKRDLYIRKETCKRDLQKRPIYYQETNPWSLRYAQHIKKKPSHPKSHKKTYIPTNTCKRQLLTIMREVRGPEERPSMSKTDLRKRPIHAYPQRDLEKRPTCPK